MNEHPSASRWRKSRYCDANSCVEVTWRGGTVAVRNNTTPEDEISVDSGSWQELLKDLHDGRLHR